MGTVHRVSAPHWAHYDEEKLLDLRFKDLRLKIDGTWLEGLVARLHDEMAAKGIRLRPHCWLSNEWFSPDGVPGIAIPFYLAHPRLRRLERRQMGEVEGGSETACMRILRHEAGHAFDTAHALRRRKRWREVFGRASRPYPASYRPRPHSRKHVLHLEWWYAQSHPAEDFAETFAVWLQPRSGWRRRYEGWPAIRKLEYVDELVAELGQATPRVRARRRVEPLSELDGTLRRHYRVKRNRYQLDRPDFHDQRLREALAAGGSNGRSESAAAFLEARRRELVDQVAAWTHQPPYTVEQFLREMVTRCRQLDLRRTGSVRHVMLEVGVLLTIQVTSYINSGGHHVPL